MTGQRRLGSHYEIGELLGRGSMGEVYRGRDTAANGHADVAIKVLKPELAADRVLVRRFIQERDILVSLDHPNLVRVRDLVAEGNDLAIVMDLVEGGDLRRTLEASGGTLTLAAALGVAAQVLDALAIVHRAGIVHRDVKPENILIPNGSTLVACLSDFGIARVTGDRGASTTHTSLIGTPYYMAPELTDGRPITAAADIYAMGCTLYELISGTVPFAGPLLLVLRRHADEDPQPIPDLPADAWQFIARLTDKDPSARPSAVEASEAARALAKKFATTAALKVMEPPVARIRATGGDERSPTRIGVTPSPRPRSTDSLDGDGLDARPGPEPGHAAVPGERQPGLPATKTMAALAAPRPWYRKPVFVGSTAVLALLALVAGVVVALGNGDDAGAEIVSPSRATFASAPALYPNGLVATRTWTLTDITKLSGSVEITNTSSQPASMEIEELIPKSVAESVDKITFDPAPDKIIERDPIVSYTITDLAPNARKTFGYTIEVEKSTEDSQARLDRWGEERDALVKARLTSKPPEAQPVTLKSISLAPTSIDVEEALTSLVTVSATMADDKPAVDAVFNAIVYTSSDTNIATVVAGPASRTITVTAGRAGTATIVAQAGDKNASVTINVKRKAGTTFQAAPGGNNNNNGSSSNAGTTTSPPSGYQPPVAPAPGSGDGNPPAPTPNDTATTTTSTTTTTTTTTVFVPPTVPCSADVGGNGPYPAENASIGGSGAAKACSAANFRGTGYIGNWNGQSLTFGVNASNGAGRYNVRFRFQNARTTATRQLTTAGGPTTVNFHNSHGQNVNADWNAGVWSESIVNVVLNGGVNNITIGGGVGFVDLDEIMEVRYTGPSNFAGSEGGSGAAGAVYQAEDASVSGIGVAGSSENPGFNGAGYIGGFGYCGNSVTFTVTGGGTRTLRFRYRSADSGAQRLVSVNGQSVFLLDFGNTGGSWATAGWAEASVTVSLPGGSATVSLEFIGDSGFGFIDLDQLTVAV